MYDIVFVLSYKTAIKDTSNFLFGRMYKSLLFVFKSTNIKKKKEEILNKAVVDQFGL